MKKRKKKRQGKARQGKARQGKARQGKAKGKAKGKARQGKARQGKPPRRKNATELCSHPVEDISTPRVGSAPLRRVKLNIGACGVKKKRAYF